jgi:hypothetical protein
VTREKNSCNFQGLDVVFVEEGVDRHQALVNFKMFKANQQDQEEFDRVGRVVLLAASRNEDEVEAAASSPFLYTRVRARIAEEQRRRVEASGWASLLLVARRAIPAMALVAVLAAILTVWSLQPSAPSPGYGLEDEALTDTRDPGVEQAVLTKNGLSRDEVFTIVVDRNAR